MYAHKYTQRHIHKQRDTHTHMYTEIHIYIHVCTQYSEIHTCTQRRVCMQIHTCMDKCIKTYTVNIYTQRYMHTHRYAHNTHTNIYNTCTHIEKYMHTHRYAHTYTDANTQIHTHTKQMT